MDRAVVYRDLYSEHDLVPRYCNRFSGVFLEACPNNQTTTRGDSNIDISSISDSRHSFAIIVQHCVSGIFDCVGSVPDPVRDKSGVSDFIQRV
jgi:hypothetical protein